MLLPIDLHMVAVLLLLVCSPWLTTPFHGGRPSAAVVAVAVLQLLLLLILGGLWCCIILSATAVSQRLRVVRGSCSAANFKHGSDFQPAGSGMHNTACTPLLLLFSSFHAARLQLLPRLVLMLVMLLLLLLLKMLLPIDLHMAIVPFGLLIAAA